MAANAERRDANCPYGHAAGSPKHDPPKVGGKAFRLTDHQATLNKAGLTTRQKEAYEEDRKRGQPPGQPKNINGKKVYPARHFG